MRFRVLFGALSLLALTTLCFADPAQVSYVYPGDWDCTAHPPLAYTWLCFEGTPIPEGATIEFYKNSSYHASQYINSEFICGEAIGGFFATNYVSGYETNDVAEIHVSYGNCHYWTDLVILPSGATQIYLSEADWDCEGFPPNPIHCDLGDLPAPYPSGIHPLGPCANPYCVCPCILGAGITMEYLPNIPDLDPCDDGVVFLPGGGPNGEWLPCTMSSVQVTIGGTSGTMYLSAWTDGNLDGDFDDVRDCGVYLASEWIIQDSTVNCGQVYVFTFQNPGMDSQTPYMGVFRFRLCEHALGAQGWMGGHCECGEVEDYMIGDLWLPVELTTFEAIAGDREVTLKWTTASEQDNAQFDVQRKTASSDWMTVGTVEGAGTSATAKDYSYADRAVVNGVTYTYRLLSRDINGMVHEYEMTAEATPAAPIPTESALHQNYPNPFNPTTRISFDIAEDGFVILKIYNLMGQEVAKLVSNRLSAGRHIVAFDGSNLPSGVYVCRIEVNDFVGQTKMLLMK